MCIRDRLDESDDVSESLDELAELADTAGAVAVGKIIQNRESVHPVSYTHLAPSLCPSQPLPESRGIGSGGDHCGSICEAG